MKALRHGTGYGTVHLVTMVSRMSQTRPVAVAAACAAVLGLSACTLPSTATANPDVPAHRARHHHATRTPAPVPTGPTTATTTSGAVSTPSSSTPAGGTAAAALATLPVKGRAPMTGYDRDEFGPAWLDADRNGCDTRNDVLRAFLTQLSVEAGTHGCVVLSGDLADSYTGQPIHFVKGDGTLVDIDHVVALGNAWVTGAYRWSIRERAALANDPLNLLPVDASANRQKGDGDAATWLPANKPYRCAYVARQVTVKAKYGLWVTAPERAAMDRVLATCPGQPLVADSGAPTIAPVKVTEPAGSGGTGSATVYYENCDAARAAGAAPVHRGDPGYDSHLDGDGDGVACE